MNHPATSVRIFGLTAEYRIDGEVIQAEPGLLSAYYYDDGGTRIVTVNVTLDGSTYTFNFDSSNVLPPITNLTIELDARSVLPGSTVAIAFAQVISHGKWCIIVVIYLYSMYQ